LSGNQRVSAKARGGTLTGVFRSEPCDILIVDDDPEVLLAAELVLKKALGSVVTASAPQQIRHHLAQRAFDVILLDMNFSAGATSGQEGIDWIKTVQSLAPDTKVILMTAYGASRRL
jgi:two-component system, NtrC family, response regulator HydG